MRKSEVEDLYKKSSPIKHVKASAGFVLPLFYKGSIIQIDELNPFEIDTNALGLEAKIQFQKALDDKHIFEIGAK
jgi:hypothetical protein